MFCTMALYPNFDPAVPDASAFFAHIMSYVMEINAALALPPSLLVPWGIDVLGLNATVSIYDAQVLDCL